MFGVIYAFSGLVKILFGRKNKKYSSHLIDAKYKGLLVSVNRRPHRFCFGPNFWGKSFQLGPWFKLAKDKAARYCANFYNPRGAVNTSVEYLANGAESVIYKCQIGESDKLNDQVPEITGSFHSRQTFFSYQIIKIFSVENLLPIWNKKLYWNEGGWLSIDCSGC